MSTKYDQEGKFFSHVIPKEALTVTIKTINSIITGEIYKKYDKGILDSLNISEQFLAITNAVLIDDSAPVEKSELIPFMIVNRDHIVWIIPKE